MHRLVNVAPALDAVKRGDYDLSRLKATHDGTDRMRCPRVINHDLSSPCSDTTTQPVYYRNEQSPQPSPLGGSALISHLLLEHHPRSRQPFALRQTPLRPATSRTRRR